MEAICKTAGISKNCLSFIHVTPLNMVSRSYRLCRQSGINSIFAPACGPSGFVELNVEDQIGGFDVFLHTRGFLFDKTRSAENKSGEVSLAALIVDVAVPLSGAAAARSAGSGWP